MEDTLTPALLADALKPFIIRWITDSNSALAASTSLNQHELSGALHAGELSPSQAPWALKIDGTRTLTGNLAVNSGVTIDGIDISVHAGDANAHHAQSHSYDSTDHTGTLSWTKVNKTGSNLSDLTNKPHSQLTGVTADQHHAQVHSVSGTDHTITGSKWVLVGATANNTLGLLTPVSSTVGPVEGVLKSDAAGAVELVKLRTVLIDTNTGQSLTLQPADAIVLTPGNNQVTLSNGKAIRSSTFVSGFAGSGFQVDQGILTAGKTSMETDNLTVRGTMSIYELLIHQIRATNGSIIVSSVGKVDAVTGTGPYVITTDPEHGFLVGDLIRAQRFTGTGVYQSNLQVTVVSDTYTFTATLSSGNAPAVGYEYVRLGSVSNANRRGGLYLTADDSGAPFLDVWNGVDAFADWNTAGIVKLRLGRLDGITAGTDEYGLIAGNTGFGTTDQWLKVSNLGTELHNIPIKLYNGATQTVNFSSAGTDIWVGPSSSDKRLTWDGTSLTIGAVTSGNVQITGGNVSVRTTTTERIGLTSAGVLTIKGSDGNAVFTFNASVGAEFTKPLTIGSAGGIYQGTGTFASPTTGLKIYQSGSIGLIAGYNTGVAQWYATTAGKLAAGGGQVILDANGLSLGTYPNLDTGTLPSSDASSVSFWDDPNVTSGSPVVRMLAAKDNLGSPYWSVVVKPGATGSNPAITLWRETDATSSLWLFNVDSVVGFPGINAAVSGVTITGNLSMTGTISAQNNVLPVSNNLYNLGSGALRWATIYAQGLDIAGTISGTVLSGQGWQYAGSMNIDANAAGTTTVSIYNTTGTANLDVENNITLGGTVDGVDVASLKTNYDSTVSSLNSHISATAAHGATGAVVGTTNTQTLSGKTLTTPTITDFTNADHTHASAAQGGTIAHSALTGVTADQHHPQDHVLATTTAPGADHTVSGLTAGMVLRATAATNVAFQVLVDADIPATLVRTSTTLTAGAGLTGTGDLSANRTFAVGQGLGITVNADDVALTTPGALSATSVDSSTGSHTHSIDSSIARSAITLTAGAGLTGTGDLTANRTFAVGAGTMITVGADDVGLSNGTAQFQIPVTGATPFTPSWTLMSTFSGAGLTFASNVFTVGQGLGLTVNANDVALTTPGTLAVATTNSSTGSHTHAVTASSNPGTTTQLLKSNVSGYLQLVRVGVGRAPAAYSLEVEDGIFVERAAGDPYILFSRSGTTIGHIRGAALGFNFTNSGGGGSILMIDVINDRIGINNATPGCSLDVTGAAYVSGNAQVAKIGAGVTPAYPVHAYETANSGKTLFYAQNPNVGTGAHALATIASSDTAITLIAVPTNFATASLADAAELYTATATHLDIRQATIGGDIRFKMGSADKVIVDNSGNVIIGAASTTYKLHVVGGGKFTGSVDVDVQFLGQPADTVAAPSFSWTADTNTGLYQPTADNIGIVTGGAERLRINGSGNISFGATDIEAWSTSFRAIELGAQAAIMAPVAASGNAFHLMSNAYYDSGWKYKTTNAAASYYLSPSGAHAFRVAPSGTADAVLTWIDAMTINVTGSVGIGGAPGAEKVVITGDLRTTGDILVDGGMVDFGTNTLTEDGTYLQVTGSKGLRLNQTISATSWSMTTAGVLSASSAGFTGGATFGSDINVGAQVLFVNVAGTRVGINRAPDQQFDLDVAGPIRGTYLVGKHAIQLSSAVGVWHFDGPEPSAIDFTGALQSHAGIAATLNAGSPVFRPGKFGKALQLAETTTNYIPNPSFEVNVTDGGWGAYGSGTKSQNTVDGLYGYDCCALTVGAGTNPYLYSGTTGTLPTLTTGENWTFSAYVKAGNSSAIGKSTYIVLREVGETSPTSTSVTVTLTTSWQRISVTRTLTTTTPTSFNYWIVLISTADSGDVLLIDGVQLEKKPYATPFASGDLPSHTWSGTANNSNSTRTSRYLTIADSISRSAYTVAGWFRVACPENTTISSVWRPRFFQIGTYNTAGSLTIAAYSTNAYVSAYGRNTVDPSWTITANTGQLDYINGDWIFVAVTWDGDKHRTYISKAGVADSFVTWTDSSRPDFYGTGANKHLYINGTADSGMDLVEELLVLDYAASSDLIRSLMESDAPYFVESSVFHWRSPGKSPIWVDEFGLWAQSYTGSAVLGIYTGNPRTPGGTKSWGGVTLDECDILLGRSTGYVLWDDSAQTLSVLGAITASSGSITGAFSVAATLTVGSTGAIVTTGVTYAAGTGIFLGYDSSAYKFRVGTTAGNRLTWDGTTLTIAGNGAGVTAISGSNISTGTIDASVVTVTNINATNITTGSLAAGRIAAGTITASHISGTTLSAIKADMGTLTAGAIVIGTTNKIWLNDTADGALNIGGATKASAPFAVTAAGVLTAVGATITGTINADAGYLSTLSVSGSLTLADSTGRIMTNGVTGYASGTGVFIGWDVINHRFRIGTPGSKYLQWDGSNLSWAGVNTSLTAAGRFTASDVDVTGIITASSGSITGALTLGASGGIYQGSGTFASPTTGLKMWNDGGTGRIGGYSSGTLQWYASTDGRMYAGGGNLRLDEEGASVLNGVSSWNWQYGYNFRSDATTKWGGLFANRITGSPDNYEVSMNSNCVGTASAAISAVNAYATVRAISTVIAESTLTAYNSTGPKLATLTVHADSSSEYIWVNTSSIRADYGGTAVEFRLDGYVSFKERTSNPTAPAASDKCFLYMKGDKLVIAFYDSVGPQVRYKYLDLTGTGVTWVHTTTAP